MKKIVLILMLLGLAGGLHANPVTPEEALQVARRVLGSQPYTKSAHEDLKIVWDGEFEATKAGSQPDFYVISGEHAGFVIVAGDNRVRPVLAFSLENTFPTAQGMPCNVEALMRGLKKYCKTVREMASGVHGQWDRLAATKAALDPGLITDEFLESRTVQWNQSDPANLKCPVVTGQTVRAVCGCVPLAYSEVMTWFGHPAYGVGTVESYTYETDYHQYHTIPAHDLGTVYDWEGLQTLKTSSQFYGESNTDLGQNLGQLVYDVGTILQASYNDYGTGASAYYMASRLCPMMGYDRGARELDRVAFAAPIWEDMLKDEVTRHPIVTSGWGHAYVNDGYATFCGTDLVFHYNIGWGGYGNGYYYMNLQDVGEPDEETDYINQAAIFGFFPDPNGTSELYTLVELTYYYDESWGWNWEHPAGIRLHEESNPIAPGASILLANNGNLNSGTVPVYGFVSAFRVNANGVRDPEPMGGPYEFFTEEEPLKNGYITGDWAEWMEAPATLSFGDRFAWYATLNGGDYVHIQSRIPGKNLDELPIFPAAMIRLEENYNAGDIFFFRLVNNDYTYMDAVWTITDPSGKSTTYAQSELGARLKISGTYTIMVETSQETIVATVNVN